MRSPSPEATVRAGRLLAASLGPGGAVIGLVGPLGAGKTLFVRGLAEGLGVAPGRVASPTFGIAHEYPRAGAPALVHVDLYRVASEIELENAGLLDWLAPGRIVAIEWSDRLPGALPLDHLCVVFERSAAGDSQRTLKAIASGAGARHQLARWLEAVRQAPDRCGLELEARAS